MLAASTPVTLHRTCFPAVLVIPTPSVRDLLCPPRTSATLAFLSHCDRETRECVQHFSKLQKKNIIKRTNQKTAGHTGKTDSFQVNTCKNSLCVVKINVHVCTISWIMQTESFMSARYKPDKYEFYSKWVFLQQTEPWYCSFFVHRSVLVS